ncbi:alpha/beta fold hydrolase [Halobacteriovorax sp. JY17]|uniref:alpha/beta fold hydrolase n=1 Tax=Halobacteriovorax sp. JY17 TaxID=2014617 RepID=UPI0025BF687D|nr:alpha/beta fold hydrolase [Halobacteriovorax sp. JY17]
MIRDYKFLKTIDGKELHLEVSESGKKKWLIVTHGIGEHLNRHSYIDELFGNSFNILKYDIRGHGRSQGGKRGYVEDFSLFFSDLKEVILFLKKSYKMESFCLFGHSMGALITAGYMQTLADEENYPDAVFLNAPPAGFPGALGELMNISPIGFVQKLAGMPFSIKLGGLVDLNYLSHDSRVKEKYIEDEFNILKPHSKLLFEMVKASKEVFSKPLRITCPSFVSYGTEDRVVSIGQLKHYLSMVDKSFKVQPIEDAYHETHNEIEKYRTPYFEFLKESLISVL